MFKSGKLLITGIFTLLIVCSLPILPGSSTAHPASDVVLEYDLVNQRFNVTITHYVGNPNTHYIDRVLVKKNDEGVIDRQYSSQPNDSTFIYSYDLAASAGDSLEAIAECNQGGSQSGLLTVTEPDTVSPTITIDEPQEGHDSNEGQIYVNGSADDDVALSSVEVRLNGGQWANAAGKESWTIQLTLAEGNNTIIAKATDTSGNTVEAIVNVTYHEPVDIVSPNVTITDPSEGQVLYTDTITVTGTASDDVSIGNVELNVNGGPWSPVDGMESWSIEVQLSEGDNAIYARATDSSGNTALDAVNVTYNSSGPPDNVPPSITILSHGEGEVLNTSMITVTGNASDDRELDQVLVRVNDGPWQNTAGNENWSAEVMLAEGPNVIRARAADSSGNTATDSVNLTYESPDTAPPVVTIDHPAEDQEFDTSGITVRGTASDESGIGSIEIGLQGGEWSSALGKQTWSGDVNLTDGNNTIRVRGTDVLGNRIVRTVNVSYLPPDVVSPLVAIIAPVNGSRVKTSSITVKGTASDEGELQHISVGVNGEPWFDAEGTDNWSAVVNLTEGANRIEVRATDAAGNEATASITVIYEVDAGGAAYVLDGIIEEGEYAFSASFDDGHFSLYWSIEGEHIRMAMKGKTTGWVSLGMEPTRKMKDADMIIGWVDENGISSVLDCYSTGDYGPHPPDTTLGGTDDILDFGGTENDGWTIIEFERLLDTGDAKDRAIRSDGSLTVIWATGDADDHTDGHGGRRGSGTIELASGDSSEEDIPVIWPLHASLMGLGFTLMAAASVLARFLRSKRWWLKVHKAIGVTGGLTSVTGLATAVYMVGASGDGHFNVTHAYLGITTVLCIVTTPVLGKMQFKVRKNKDVVKALHRWSGRISLLLMLSTIIGGLILVGVL